LLVRQQAKRTHLSTAAPMTPFVESESSSNVTSSSFPELDANLYGGIPKGSNILITGKIGAGKSSFGRHFIEEGLKQGEKCLWITLDDDPKKIRKKLNATLPLDATDYESQNQLRFVDAYSWSSMTQSDSEPFAINGALDLNQLSGIISDASYELDQTIQKKSGGRRIVDSISSLLINFELANVQRFLNQIARTAVSFGGITTLFIIEEGTVEEQTLNNIKYIMDGIIEFKEENEVRQMRVSSMKWTSFNKNWIDYPKTVIS